jgi:Copper transport outer membrane protein, MctB
VISFRYHLVTIIAVFLALGLGILMGTTVIKQSVVDNLRAAAERAINSNHALQKDVTEARAQLQQWDQAGKPLQHLMVQGQLAGDSVVLVTAEGVDFAEVNGVKNALTDAQANVTGVLAVTSRMALTQDAQRQQLAAILGLPQDAPAADVVRKSAESLAVRLAQGPPQTGEPDILTQLSDAGFIVSRDVGKGGIAQVGGPSQPVVVLSGGAGPPAVAPGDFFVPLVSALVQSSHPVAAGETFATDYEFVSLVRGDGTIDGNALTVDDADMMFGRVAMVLGLRDLLLDGPGTCLDYGMKSGACDVVPSPPPSP